MYYGPSNLVSVSNRYVTDNNITRNVDNNQNTVVLDMDQRSSVPVGRLQDVVPNMFNKGLLLAVTCMLMLVQVLI